MPPLKPWQIMPVPPPTLPSATGPPCAAASADVDVFGSHVVAVDVVEQPVVGLADDGQRPVEALAAGLDLRSYQRVANDAETVGVGEPDRRGELPRLADPLQPGQFAAAVEPVRTGEDRLGPDVVVRDDHRHAGVDACCPASSSVVCPTRTPGDVGDGVVRSGGMFADDDAEISGTHAILQVQ